MTNSEEAEPGKEKKGIILGLRLGTKLDLDDNEKKSIAKRSIRHLNLGGGG